MCEKDRSGGRGGEGPLEEVYLSTLLFSGKWKDELRMLACGGFDAAIGIFGHDSAEGL